MSCMASSCERRSRRTDAGVHVRAAAAGDDGFVPIGQAREELEETHTLFFGRVSKLSKMINVFLLASAET